MRLLVLSLLAVILPVSLMAEVKIYRHSDHGLKAVSACVLPWPKRDYIRVCIANKRYVIRHDTIGGYYLEQMFVNDSELSKCGCSGVEEAIDKYLAAKPKVVMVAKRPAKKSTKTVAKKKREGMVTISPEIVAVNPFGTPDGEPPFTCVKCN